MNSNSPTTSFEAERQRCTDDFRDHTFKMDEARTDEGIGSAGQARQTRHGRMDRRYGGSPEMFDAVLGMRAQVRCKAERIPQAGFRRARSQDRAWHL